MVAALQPAGPPGFAWRRRRRLHQFLNAGKKSIAPAPKDARFKALLSRANVVVHDLPTRSTRAKALASALAKNCVEVALRPFPEDGPYSQYKEASNVLLALGGYHYLTGDPGREPLPLPGLQPEYLTGMFGVIAALAGLMSAVPGWHFV